MERMAIMGERPPRFRPAFTVAGARRHLSRAAMVEAERRATVRAAKPGDPFYSSMEWRAARVRIRARDSGRCVVCNATESLRVDHIVPLAYVRAIGRPDLATDPRNLRTLCESCNRLAAAHWRRHGIAWRWTGQDPLDTVPDHSIDLL